MDSTVEAPQGHAVRLEEHLLRLQKVLGGASTHALRARQSERQQAFRDRNAHLHAAAEELEALAHKATTLAEALRVEAA